MIVTENLLGDILSDLAAGLMGGMGVAPSADVGDTTPSSSPATARRQTSPARASPTRWPRFFRRCCFVPARTKPTRPPPLPPAGSRRPCHWLCPKATCARADLGGTSSTEDVTQAVLGR